MVTPPQGVRDPVRLVVLDYGCHASLVVPDEQGSPVEHAFGEWGWYVENRTGWWRAPGILLLPRQGAQGRRMLECAFDDLEVATGAESGLAISVERQRVGAWQARMNSNWDAAAQRHSAVRNEVHQMDLVESEARYWMFNTCNAAVAGWLEELGCEVSGWTIGADFKLAAEPAAESAGAGTPP